VPSARDVEAVRRFNRFYTRRIGILHDGYLHSSFSLAQVRVLYELAYRERPTATELGRDLGLDAGYLSRILSGFERRGLVARASDRDDGRRTLLSLTRKGERTFASLDARSQGEMGALLRALRADDRARLIAAMRAIEGLLGAPATKPAVRLRTHRPGDMGWVVQRHGALYFKEYGWDETFEALVASIVAKFIQHLDPNRERCWIAELDGEPVGSVFCVKRSPTVAQLRLLLVEPRARGLGIGRRLVDECVAFARAAGYRKIMLWTNDVLVAARRIYERAGFELIDEEKHHSFGHDLVGQSWERRL
jgi:DNA-binding MarR family transcriptional regulator/GNAT superfamily N-acetyltransferase